MNVADPTDKDKTVVTFQYQLPLPPDGCIPEWKTIASDVNCGMDKGMRYGCNMDGVEFVPWEGSGFERSFVCYIGGIPQMVDDPESPEEEPPAQQVELTPEQQACLDRGEICKVPEGFFD
jgi:hypothetical protein